MTLHFARGDGADTVVDNYYANVFHPGTGVNGGYTSYDHRDGGSDKLTFGAGISLSHLMVQWSESKLIVGVRNPADPDATFAQLTNRITLQNWTDAFDRVERLPANLRVMSSVTTRLATLILICRINVKPQNQKYSASHFGKSEL